MVLHPLDRTWAQRYRRFGTLVRYADDLCVLCPTKERAEVALAVLRTILDGLGLALAPAKTRIVGVASGTVGFDFLGCASRDWRLIV